MILKELALNPTLIVAGFGGGLVHVFTTGQKELGKIVGSLVTGLLVANYLGGMAAHYAKTLFGEALTEPAAGFVMGYLGMRAMTWIATAVKQRTLAAATKGVDPKIEKES